MNRFIEIQNEHDQDRLHYYKTLTIYTNELLQENKIELKVDGLFKFFIDNPLNKPFINHIDGNKKNNHNSNLEWVTDSENERHSYNILNKQVWNKNLQLPKGRNYKGPIKPVLQIDPETDKIIKEWLI